MLEELDSQISEKKKVLDAAKDQLKELNAKLKQIQGNMTNETYVEQIGKMKASNAEAEAKLHSYTSEGAKQVTEEEVDEVKQGYEKYQKYWRMRRRACLEIVDMICDSVDQNRKEFFE